METTDYLFVGAGLAGIACAKDLGDAGQSVALLDKGRTVGGRAATRRFAQTRVDHGAQFFTAKDSRFREIVQAAQEAGWIRVWSRGFPLWKDGAACEREAGHERYAPPGGMSDLPKRLADGLTVHTQAQVTALKRNGDLWQAECADGRTFAGSRLVLNLPPAQLLALAKPHLPAETIAALEAIEYQPAWTLLARLKQDISAEWPALEVQHPTLAWISRDHTKRTQTPDAPPVLVAHGSGEWSRQHVEDAPEDVQSALLAAVREIVGPFETVETAVHRWRYATPQNALSEPFLSVPDAHLYGCGEWGVGGRVEGALLSGWKLAAFLKGV